MKKIAVIISLLSLISAFTFNTINISKLKENSIELRDNQTVITADDISYISPALNYLETNTFKNNMTGKGSYFLRPPGYSLLFIATGYFFNMETSLIIIKTIQLLLHALSVFCLFFIAYRFLDSKKLSILITAIYGITNLSSGFLFYTLTEAITPALVIFYLFFLVFAKAQANPKIKKWYYYFASIIFSFIFITRPVLGILGLAIPYFLFSDYWNTKSTFFLRLLITGTIAFSSMFLWQVRNWNITGEFVGLHPIYYHESSASCFRPSHEALWELCKGWGETGENFHSYIGPFWKSAINGQGSEKDIDKIINEFPSEVVSVLGRQSLENMFRDYQSSIKVQKYYYDNKLPMPVTSPKSETKTIKQLKQLETKFKKHFWFQYYISSPLKVFKELAFHSNLSLYIFQKTYRGNFFMELLRILTFAIHSLAFCTLIFSLFLKIPIHFKSIISYAPIIYIFYLIFVQRGIEERYTLPILSLVLLNFAYILKNLGKLSKKLLSK